jgi:hypothetical protein
MDCPEDFLEVVESIRAISVGCDDGLVLDRYPDLLDIWPVLFPRLANEEVHLAQAIARRRHVLPYMHEAALHIQPEGLTHRKQVLKQTVGYGV